MDLVTKTHLAILTTILTTVGTNAQMVKIGTIQNPDPADGDLFGTAASVSSNWILAGAPGNDDPRPLGGGIYLYRHALGTNVLPTGLATNGNSQSPAVGRGASITNEHMMYRVYVPYNPDKDSGGFDISTTQERDANNAFAPVYHGFPSNAPWYHTVACADDGYTRPDGTTAGVFVLVGSIPFPFSMSTRMIGFRTTDPLGSPNPDMAFISYGGVQGYKFSHNAIPDIHNWFISDSIVSDDELRGGVGIYQIAQSGLGFQPSFHSYAEAPLAESSVKVVGSSIDGDYLAMGMPEHVNAASDETGTVYIYKQTSPGMWTYHQQLSPSPLNDGDRFGYCIRIRDGIMLIGAPGDELTSPPLAQDPNPGRIYVYTLDTATDNWIESQILDPGGTVSEFSNNYTFGLIFDFRNGILAAGNPWEDLYDNDGLLQNTSTGAIHLWSVFSDCDNNGTDDTTDIDNGNVLDLDLNGTPDSCDISNGEPDCNNNGLIDNYESNGISDIVILLDTSGSLNAVANTLCQNAGRLIYDLSSAGYPVRVTYMSVEIQDDPPEGFGCIDLDVSTLYCDGAFNTSPCDRFNCSADSSGPAGTNDRENWALGTELIADNFNWLPGARRIIVPISDTGAECDDCGTQASTSAINFAIAAAVANNVLVSPMAVPGSPSFACVVQEMQDLADGSQATGMNGGFLTDLSTGDDLIQTILLLIQNNSTDADCNSNGIPDDCECVVTADLVDDDVINNQDFTLWLTYYNTGDIAGDMNCDGIISPTDFSAWLAAFDSGYVGCP